MSFEVANNLPKGLNETLVLGQRLAETPLGIKSTAPLHEAKGWKELVKTMPTERQPFVALMLENYKQWRNDLDEDTRSQQIGNFDKFAFPIIAMVAENLVAHDLVSVQPMSGPSGQVFYMDFVMGQAKGTTPRGATIWDARTGHPDRFTDTSDIVEGEVLFTQDGVAVNFTGNFAYRPIRAGTIKITNSVSGDTWVDDGNGNLSGGDITAATVNYETGAYDITLSAGTAGDIASATYSFVNEGYENTTQMDIVLTSSPIFVQKRAMRARWSLEASQVLRALHGLDAEEKVTTAVSNNLQFEIDREIITDIRTIAGAGQVTWDGTISAASTISFMEHLLSFQAAVTEASNFIYRATNRVSGTWILAGIQTVNIIQSLPTFESSGLPAERDGVAFLGTLMGQYKVFADPHFPVDEFVVGYKGDQFLRTGYIFAPWILLYTTPTIPWEDMLLRKAFASQYGKKIVNSKYYAKGKILNYPTTFDR